MFLFIGIGRWNKCFQVFLHLQDVLRKFRISDRAKLFPVIFLICKKKGTSQKYVSAYYVVCTLQIVRSSFSDHVAFRYKIDYHGFNRLQ